jgi:hypothetical protein
MEEPTRELSQRWTRELLERCTPRELLVVCAAYGTDVVARRMGYADVAKFAIERTQTSKAGG